jgi:hypothetical protein
MNMKDWGKIIKRGALSLAPIFHFPTPFSLCMPHMKAEGK